MPDITLPTPGPGGTPGPQYAQMINSAIDSVNDAVDSVNDVVETGRLSEEAVTSEIVDTGDARYATRRLAAPIATASAAQGTIPPAVAANTIREFPVWRKHTALILPFDAQAAPSILGMVMLDMRGWPGALDNILMLYSTDHGTDAATTGVYGVWMSDPYGTDRNPVGRLLGGGTLQPESPAAWLDWDAGVIRLLVSTNTGTTPPGEAQAEQRVDMYTSATAAPGTFAFLDTVMAKPSGRPGVPVVEYVRIWRLADTMYAYTIDGGGAFALWRSTQGGLPGTWQIDGERILNLSDQICTLDGYDIQWLAKLNAGAMFDVRGRSWWAGGITGPAAGVEGFAFSELYTAPMRPDFKGFAAKPVKITAPKEAYEPDARFGSLGSAFQYGPDLFLPYRVGEKNTGVGIMIMNQGGA